MENYTVKEISIDKLLLDLSNPRHVILENQDAAIKQMLLDQDDKLVNLASDIVSKGINPSDLTMVMPDINDPDSYIVLEGNRRVAAIKLLHNPLLAKLGQKVNINKSFEEYNSVFKNTPINTLQCVIFDSREDATHWIELKHTGENKGVGIVPWNSEAIARFKQNNGKPSLALQVVEFVKGNATLSETTKQNLENVPITNIVRLVSDPDIRKALGIQVSSTGELESTLPVEEVVKGLTKIVTDVVEKRITVNDIRHKNDRQDYLKTFTPAERPNSSTLAVSNWNLQNKTSSTNTTPTSSIGRKKATSVASDRKTIIPAKCVLRIKHIRINKIYKELKGLQVDDYPNACAVMLRIFLELSLEEYATINHVVFSKDPTLANKLEKVADYIGTQSLMTKNELKPIRVAYSSQDALFSTNTLHAYIHNKNFSPKASELKVTWDNMQKFFETMWP